MDTTIIWIIIAGLHFFLAVSSYLASRGWVNEAKTINKLFRYYLDDTNTDDDKGLFESTNTYFNRITLINAGISGIAIFLAFVDGGIIEL